MDCSSVVTTLDEVSIEVDEDVAELTITRHTRTTELLANLHAIRLIQASAFHYYVMHVCMYISVITHHACYIMCDMQKYCDHPPLTLFNNVMSINLHIITYLITVCRLSHS